MIIAIDGPSGAGKSTISKIVASRLCMSCLDTGAMYRSVAWKALHDGVALDDQAGVSDIASHHEISFQVNPSDPNQKRVFVDDVDVTHDIRTPDIDTAVSRVAAVPQVRAALVVQQQRIGRTGDYVVEGRDIGTNVFPDAEVKVFLTASAEERARRRVAQNAERGIEGPGYDELLAAIQERDQADATRATDPLIPADDACVLDSTDTDIEGVVQKICDLARRARARK